MDVLVAPVNTGVSASPRAMRIPESNFSAANVLWFWAVDWSIADCNLKYEECFDVRRINAVFCNGRNEIMRDVRVVNLDS